MSTTTYTTHIVYKTTNLVNNKIYIGIHSTNDINDGYLGSGRAFLDAVAFYGKQSFVREVLYVFDTREAAAIKESEIVTSDFVLSENTYNIIVGGSNRILPKIRKKKYYLPLVKEVVKKRHLKPLTEKERRRLIASTKYKLWQYTVFYY